MADNEINAFRGFNTLLFGFGLAGAAALAVVVVAVVAVVAAETVGSGAAVVACTSGADGLTDIVGDDLAALLGDGKFNVVVVNPVGCAGDVGNVLAWGLNWNFGVSAGSDLNLAVLDLLLGGSDSSDNEYFDHLLEEASDSLFCELYFKPE